MKKFSLIILAFIGCSQPPVQSPLPQQPVVRPEVVQPQHKKQVKADGDYVSFTLPCKCGDFLVYVPQSCPCFDKGQYPDLAPAVEAVHAWAKRHCTNGNRKLVGEYKLLTLECGCVLQVYVPESSGCLEKQSPDLAKLLKNVYNLAKGHEEK